MLVRRLLWLGWLLCRFGYAGEVHHSRALFQTPLEYHAIQMLVLNTPGSSAGVCSGCSSFVPPPDPAVPQFPTSRAPLFCTLKHPEASSGWLASASSFCVAKRERKHGLHGNRNSKVGFYVKAFRRGVRTISLNHAKLRLEVSLMPQLSLEELFAQQSNPSLRVVVREIDGDKENVSIKPWHPGMSPLAVEVALFRAVQSSASTLQTTLFLLR